MKSYPYISRN